jgi:uncharacterized membrane protein YbhN (UPF0104 family)
VGRLHAHPGKVTIFAFALATGAVIAIAIAYGLDTFAKAWSSPHYGWLALVLGGELLAMPAYVVAYRAVTQVHGGPPLAVPLAVRIVTAGFGPFAVQGGFSVDRNALHAIHDDEHEATVGVLSLGALEWALLAPAAWVSAVVSLSGEDSKVMDSLAWPWAVAVPIGFGLGLWLSGPSRRGRIAAGEEGWRHRVALALHGIGALHALAGDLRNWWRAWIGAALYWTLDIACLYGSVRFIGLRADLAETILAYATGYALTRRSTPLGGAGATEALMTFSLHWVGQPVPGALAAVVVYRVFNFALPTVPALIVRRRVGPLLDAGYERRAAAEWEHDHAAAPLSVRRRSTAP